jgi:hypothetical protein
MERCDVVPLLTRGFYTAADLSEHFEKHVTIQKEFTVTTEAEYLKLADKFLGESLNTATTYECQRVRRDGSLGDKIRYNRITQEYGVLSVDNRIRTYFIADPAVHGFRTNFVYFRSECRKVR